MKLVSWNVNGLRACIGRSGWQQLMALDADYVCLQETKMHMWQSDIYTPGYFQVWNSAERKGYAGTLVLTKRAPINVMFGEDTEGRVLILENPEFFLVTVYTPNSKRDFSRLSYRQEWDKKFADTIRRLMQTKPVVVCGDLNVAHTDADVWNAVTCARYPGFQPEEKRGFDGLLATGLADTYRVRHHAATDAFTWWSYQSNGRTRNNGMRLDYFLVDMRLLSRFTDATIYSDIHGSDHCPVGIALEV